MNWNGQYPYISGIDEMVNNTNTPDEQGCSSTENPERITTENGSHATKNGPCAFLPLGIQAIAFLQRCYLPNDP